MTQRKVDSPTHQTGALNVYLVISLASSLAFSLIFTINMVYQVTVAKLDPLQLVLIGTVLEATTFLFEIPTGLLADIKSRRLSIIIGYGLMGCGFLVEGSLPVFWAICLAQVLWGLGYTFTSGATEAWISDEIGEQQAGRAFMRGAQLAQVGGLLAIPLSIGLAQWQLNVPILAGGTALILVALYALLAMPETGFKPVAPTEPRGWKAMTDTVYSATQIIRQRPILLTLLIIQLFYGLYSEGFDRLWTAHLLQDSAFPVLGHLDPVIWFGLIALVGRLLSLGATGLGRRYVEGERRPPVGRILMWNAAGTVILMVLFGLTGRFWPLLLLYWGIGTLRTIVDPLYNAWFNEHVDSASRATLFSVSGQANAIGQVAGGPAVGLIGRRLSVSAALITSATLLSPVVPLFGLTKRQTAPATTVEE